MARVFNNRILLFIIAALLVSNIAMLVMWYKWTHDDHRPQHGGDNGRSPMALFLETKVGFSKQQLTAFEQLRKDHRQMLKPMFEDLKNTKSGFFKLVTASNLSDSLLQAESMKIAVKQQGLDIQTIKNFRQLRDLCTEQQRPVYDSLMPGIISEMWFPNRRGPRPGNGDNSQSQKR